MGEASAESPLCHALQNKIIPWVEREGMDKFIVAAPSYRELITRKENLPDGMSVVHRPLRGRRKAVRSSRVYGSTGIVNARWPEDDLQSTRTPKLCFVLSGAIAYPVADYKLVCQAGHGLLLPAGIPFATGLGKESISFTENSTICEILQIIPYQDSLNCWITTKTIDSKGRFSNTADVASIVHSKVPDYIKSLMEEALLQKQFHAKLCCNWLHLIFHELYRELSDTMIVKACGYAQRLDEKNIAAGNGENLVLQAHKYILKNLAAGLSIDDVANYVCMSRSVFTKKFREHTGMSFTAYTTRLRIKEAQLLLRETDLSINQVGKTVGITTARLRALFQGEFSLSPTQYREKHRQDNLTR